MPHPRRTVQAAVTAVLHAAGAPWRRVADGEWGMVVEDVGGRPLEVGLRLSGGLLRIQAWVAPPGVLDRHHLLHANRLGTLVRYAEASDGSVHVHAELLEEHVDGASLDRVLGRLVDAAEAVRR